MLQSQNVLARNSLELACPTVTEWKRARRDRNFRLAILDNWVEICSPETC